MCPTPKTARARQSQPDDPHTPPAFFWKSIGRLECVTFPKHLPICQALLERKPCLCPTFFPGQPIWFGAQSATNSKKSTNIILGREI